MPEPLRQVLLALGVVLLQWLVVSRLQLFGAFADVVLLYVAWTGLRHGRVPGAVAGFGTGLLLGAVTQQWGAQMLVKTLMGFAAGQFQARGGEGPVLSPLETFAGALALALVHNGLLVIVLALEHGTRTAGFLIGSLWIGSAVLTAFVALLWALARGR